MSDTFELAGAIRKSLWQIIDTFDESLEPVRRATGSHVTGSNEPPLPISAHILDVRAMTCSRLAGWALIVIEEQKLHPWLQAGDALALSRFLLTHADWLAGFEAGPDAADEIALSARELRAIALPEHRDWMPIGECPILIGTDPCGAKVRAYAERNLIKCPRCGTEDTLGWWMSQIIPEGSDMAHADAVIACVTSRTFRPISHEQLRQWASRRFILRHGKDTKGRTLYSSRAVLAYAQDGQKEVAA